MRDLSRNVWKIFGPKGEKVTGDWGTLHNEKLHGLYSPNTVVMTRSRRLRLVGHVACMGDRRGA
jgi:hypothetical protein